MWKFVVLVVSIFFTFSVYATELECFEYSPQYFVASNKDAPFGKEFSSDGLATSIEKVYLLKLPKIRKNNFQNLVGIAVKAAGKIYQNHNFECEAEKGRFYCRGECDSGQVWFDHKMRLKFQFVSYNEVNGTDGFITLFELRPKDDKHWIEGKKVVCPKEVKRGKYVCYGKKDAKHYYFCERSIESCESIGKMHFGRYFDESSTRAALMRCWTIKPKKN